jgi:hypothetical protein
MLEVVEAVAGAIGAERTGIRLSPYNSFLSAQDSVNRAIEKNVWLMKQIEAKAPGLAYIHMVSWVGVEGLRHSLTWCVCIGAWIWWWCLASSEPIALGCKSYPPGCHVC